MIRATIDTNILASAIISKKPTAPRLVYLAIREAQITLITAQSLLDELEEVLNRPHMLKLHGLSSEGIHQRIALLAQLSIVVPVEDVPPVSPDPDDDILFACAVAGQANYIISGDKKHVLKIGKYQGIPTITAKELIDLISS